MIELEYVYALTGLLFAAFALLAFFHRTNRQRLGNAAFWALLAFSFLLGSHIGDFANGLLVIAMALIAGLGAMGGKRTESVAAEHARGTELFLIALLIPIVALVGSIALKNGSIGRFQICDKNQVTLVSLALGVLLALLVIIIRLKPAPMTPIREGYRLMELIGWASVLPQMLAALGAVFALAGVGKAVGDLTTHYLPLTNPFTATAAYCVGMALFTVVMGNAFAAFPVMTAAIGLPLVVHRFGGNAIVMSAMGMLCGFCGTLMTPMAANFNIVPAALLELPDRSAVIKAQLPTAIALLIANTVLMYLVVFRF